MTQPDGILVVGGYGVVGRRIAVHLSRAFPGRVVIAGRNRERASSVSVEIGYDTRPRTVDLNDAASIETALDGVGTVVNCVAQRDMGLLRASIRHGLAYTDIAPRLAFWEGTEEMNVQSRRTGAQVVLGAGLSPGISNMMARQLADALGRVDRIETAILLSVGDEYGPDSLSHVLDAMSHPFMVLENGEHRAALPFREGRRVRFPEPFGFRVAYLFPWSDVVFYPKTLGARTALGRFALDPPWAGRVASLFLSAGAQRWLRPETSDGNRWIVGALRRLYSGRDGFALVVTAESEGRTLRMSLVGRRQADATAAGAAELARALAAGEVQVPGVWLPEEVIPPVRFFDAIRSRGFETLMEQI